MDTLWELERMKLFQIMQEHPDWSTARLAETIQHSLSWVKKWCQRFRNTKQVSLELFQSQSRAPKTRSKSLTPLVRDVILSLRDQLKAIYGRVVGPKPILYHLQQDPLLKQNNVFVPRSSCTIWRVLKDGGRIPTRVHDHHPVERPTPMEHWEMDFGQLADQIEFFAVVDRGTSILVDTQTDHHFNAETALLAIAKLLLFNGLPKKLRFDRDSRFLGTWAMDGYPSPLLRFLWCIGVEPDPMPPRRPDLKPFVERCIRTLKYECLWEQQPETPEKADEILREYRYFYNHQRANQSSACQNRPPYAVFPTLPDGLTLPETVDPDRWLSHYHHLLFKRRVGAHGIVSIDRHIYYLGTEFASQRVAFQLDAHLRQIRAFHKGKVIKTFQIQGLYGQSMSFGDYLSLMLDEARSMDRQQQLNKSN
ncbi:MAG: transposase [Anaerolineae bacterium]|nr:transposase [Anaerolineae bacterium]